MIEIELWKSDNSKSERHHYFGNSYLFGFSTDFLSKKLYKKVLLLVKEEIKRTQLKKKG